MTCELSNKNKEVALRLLGNVVRNKIAATPDEIVKSIYDTVYQEFVKKDMKKEAQGYGVAMAQYAAKNLNIIVTSDKDSIRELYGMMIGTENQFTQEYFDLLATEDKIRQLVGLDKVRVENTPTLVKKEDVQSTLDKIQKAFPQVLGEATYTVRGLYPARWKFLTVKDMLGIEAKLVRVTEFVKNKMTQNQLPSQQIEATAGTLIDIIIRKFFSAPTDYQTFKEKILQDKQYINTFRNFMRDSIIDPAVPRSTLEVDYMSSLVDDALYAINFIQTNYQDAYLTDLTELVNKSDMSPDQKLQFALYSAELGLKGELDLLAIYPNGTFTVIDIKTSRSIVGNTKKEQYTKQVSAYSMIITKATGMKSTGKGDIIYLGTSIINPSNVAGIKENNYKLSINSYTKESNDLVPLDILEDQAKKFNKEVVDFYYKIAPMPSNAANRAMRDYNAFNFNSKGKRDKGAKMIFKESDPLSTHENLVKGQQWLRERFPEIADRIQIIREINSEGGGKFLLDAIVLFEKSNENVAYHEGWHRFSQIYMTVREKIDLYNSIRNDNITFTTRDGRTINTKESDFHDIEEMMAEEFRKYAQNPESYTFPKGNPEPKNWFQKIWAAIKALFGFYQKYGSHAYVRLFQELDSNSFNRSNYSLDNAIFYELNSIFIDTINGKENLVDNKTLKVFTKYADLVVGDYMTQEALTIEELVSDDNLAKLHNLIKEDFINTRNSLIEKRAAIKEEISTTTDDALKTDLQAQDSMLQHTQDTLDIFLETNSDGELIRIKDFLSAYYAISDYSTFRKYAPKSAKVIAEQMDAEEDEISEDATLKDDTATGDEKTSDERDDYDKDDPYNDPGNTKSFSERSRDNIKDFFNGIPRHADTEVHLSSLDANIEIDENGLPILVSKQEAMAKTIRIMSGAMTWENIQARLNIEKNYHGFPELIHVKERLFGRSGEDGIPGLIPRYKILTGLVRDGIATPEQIAEQSRLLGFVMHFTYIMSLNKVDFDTIAVRANLATEDEETIKKTEVVSTRLNMESIIYSIINDFTKGFQIAREKQLTSDPNKNYASVYDVLYDLFSGEGVTDAKTFNEAIDQMNNESVNKLQKYEYLYDPRNNKFFFNVHRVLARYNRAGVDPTQSYAAEYLKGFYEELGIIINDRAYSDPTDLAKLSTVYTRLQEVLRVYRANWNEVLFPSRMNAGNLTYMIKRWKEIKNKLDDKELTLDQRLAAEVQLSTQESALYGHVHSLFPDNPVEQLLYDGRDIELRRSSKRNRVFAANAVLFQRLADVERNYHKRFSIGTMLVVDKLQYSYYLPNNMLITQSLLNDGSNNFSEFNKYKELSHLDPTVNPAVLNSLTFRSLYDSVSGVRKNDFKLGVTNISQLSIIYDEGNVENKKMSELSEDRKILFDFMMVLKDGSSEMRRMEASNTAWRMSLQDYSKGDRKFVKFARITSTFNNPTFLSAVRGYIQHAAWKYQYNLDEENRKTDSKYPGLDKLGIFDEMMPIESNKIKEFIRKGGDMNTLMNRIEEEDPALFTEINNGIINYFEDITINNSDSYKNLFNEKIPQDSESYNILRSVASVRSGGNIIQLDGQGKVWDYLFRDFIANDFIMAMEDSILFFGDYTYYKDPIKRRKIIANNGSVNMVDPLIAEGIAAQESLTLTKLYQNNKSIQQQKDYSLVSKTVIQDVVLESPLVKEDKDGSSIMIRNLQTVYKQRFGVDLSVAEIKEDKRDTIDNFSKMQLADGSAYISLDTYRRMRIRDGAWNWNIDEKEYKRQLLILKDKLGEELSEEEKREIKKKPYTGFNIAKYALTGAIYERGNSPFKPMFDKMGLRVILPETDWDSSSRPIFEMMLEKGLDYVVFDSSTKGYQPVAHKVFDESLIKSTINSDQIRTMEHAGGWFKFQQNTTHITDKSTLSIQLRSIFYEISLIQEKFGKKSPHLEKAYKNMVAALIDYVRISAYRSTVDMGLDINGNVIDNKTFITYLHDKLLAIGEIDPKLLDLLTTNKEGNLTTFFEALPFQQNIMDVIAGVVDNFRKVKLNGSKLYQTQELGTTKVSAKSSNKEKRGTIELKWHDLEFDKDGNAISTTPVECKINFRQQFYPLLKLKHPDGQIIGTMDDMEKALKRLNEAIQNKEWAKTNKESITFIGVRIPMQDLSFTSHIIVREFLPESAGDMIIMPPEFYQQTGGDNDIDTIYATFRFLDGKGKPVRRPEENYEDIIKRIGELSTQLDVIKVATVEENTTKIISDLKNEFIENGVFRNSPITEVDSAFRIVDADGLLTLEGLTNDKSPLYKVKSVELMEKLQLFLDSLNVNRKLKSDTAKELASLNRKRDQYQQGISNDMVASIYAFSESPENYIMLTETDVVARVKEIGQRNQSRLQGKEVTLNDNQTSLQAMSYAMNVVNHVNNFQIRSMLGSFVRFRSMLTFLVKNGTSLSREYRAHNLGYLADSHKSVYKRTLHTPLLSQDPTGPLKLSIFDESGKRITKNLSMLVSSLLDLFKNPTVFPSLGIRWPDVKPMIYLLTQGVPLEKVIIFMNNPFIREVKNNLTKMGTSAMPKHAYVHTVQRLDDAIDTIYGDRLFDENAFEVYTYINGKEVIKKSMRRPGKFAEEKLANREGELRFTTEQLVEFTEAYAKYENENKGKSNMFNMFMRANKQFAPLLQDIMAYYGTLLEDGDLFYALGIKGLGRPVTKMNSISAISTAQRVKESRKNSEFFNGDFDDRIEKDSMHAAFFNDTLSENIISNAMPELMSNKDKYFSTKFKEMIRTVTNQTFGNEEDRRKVEIRIMSDFTELIYKNFYILNKDGQYNTLYEMYQGDISPLLPALLAKSQGDYRKLAKDFSLKMASTISEGDKIQALYNQNTFANQIDILLVKYPELRELSMLTTVINRKERGREGMYADMDEIKGNKNIVMFNSLSQSYLLMNLPTNSEERKDLENIIRDEWEKLSTFDITLFPNIMAKVAGSQERLDFYRNPENKAELMNFARTLVEYSLAQASHITRGRSSFSYLAPSSLVKEIVQKSFENFNRFLREAGSVFGGTGVDEAARQKAISNVLKDFAQMFPDMNPDLKWSNPYEKPPKAEQLEEGANDGAMIDLTDDVELDDDMTIDLSKKAYVRPNTKSPPYMKGHTGKLYSKLNNDFIETFKKRLFKEMMESLPKAERTNTLDGRNMFSIKPPTEQDSDLTC